MSFFAKFRPAGEEPAQRPVAHQERALANLAKRYGDGSRANSGGLLVVPTGGGKTFIAVRFLCEHPLSQGRKVLWLAHTHHRLEQAYVEFAEGVKMLAPNKAELRVRVTSGAEGHWDASRVEAEDDVVIGTLQTIRGGLARKAPGLVEFIEAAGDELVVVFDEAHHSPARTYRQLLLDLRAEHPSTYFLGLTATPWPLLAPQWKDPVKWWKQLASEKGFRGKHFDWSHLAARYWPTRVDAKCQEDPSLAVAHGCFWKYHPERAYEWELRLQYEIEPDFTIDEDGSDDYRAAFLAEHAERAHETHDAEMKRRAKEEAKKAEKAQQELM